MGISWRFAALGALGFVFLADGPRPVVAVLEVPGDYSSLQETLDSAGPGDEVVVAPGVHTGSFVLPATQGLVLRSADPDDPEVVEATVLDGGGGELPVLEVALSGHLDRRVSGLTLRNGRGGILSPMGAWMTVEKCRVIENSSSGIRGVMGTIRGNLISSNTVTGEFSVHGGGIAEASLTLIEDNVIAANQAVSAGFAAGGGVGFCSGAVLRNNVITSNTASGGSSAQGGGVYQVDDLIGNVLIGNSAIVTGPDVGGVGGGAHSITRECRGNLFARNHASSSGGGVSEVSGNCTDNVIVHNTAGWSGGGIWSTYGGVFNCTIAFNSAGIDGGAVRGITQAFVNCILWGNSSPQDIVSFSVLPTHSCVQEGVGGRYNMSQDPRFADPGSLDFRLAPDSPCIDAGNRFCLFKPPMRDADGLGRLAGASVDLGAYEFGAEPDADGDLLSDAAEALAGTDPQLADTDGDGLIDGAEVDRGTDPASPDTPTGLVVTPTSGTVQQALFHAFPLESVSLTTGTYAENVHLLGKVLTLEGPRPSTHETIRDTVIDGGDVGVVVSMYATETHETLIRGLTLARGFGILGAAGVGAGSNGSVPFSRITVENCFIRDNRAIPAGGGGAGFYQVFGNFRNCVFFNNLQGGSWRLIYTDGVVENCAFYGNTGAAVFLEQSGRIRNSIVWNPAGVEPVTGFPTLDVEHCNIFGWAGGGTGNISADPRFRDPGNGDFRLRGDSPCIDAGTSETGPVLDYEGEARFGPTDIGADEYQPNTREISVSTESLDFGPATVDDMVAGPLQVTIANVGAEPLGFVGAGIWIDGPDASDFSFVSPPDTSPLGPSTTRAVEVVFDPSAPGLRTAVLHIAHDDVDNADFQIALSGQGVEDLAGFVRPYTGQGPGKSTIGAGGTYPTLKAACDAINAAPLTGGDWVFEIIGDLAMAENVAIGQETNGHAITFRPAAGLQPTITFSGAEAAVGYAGHWVIGTRREFDSGTGRYLLVPTSNIVIDGSHTPGERRQDLTITSVVGASASTTLIHIVGDSDSNTVRNVKLIGGHTGASSTFGVLLSQILDPAAGVTEAAPDHNLVENCQVVNDLSGSAQGFSVAVTAVGGALASRGSVGNVFRDNDIQARTRGFFLHNAQEITITSNTIRVNQIAPATSGFGLLATDLGHVMSDVTFNITGNNLAQLNAATNHPDGYGVTGIQLESNGSGHVYNVTNNMIGGLKLTRTSASSAGQLCGIRHAASNDATLNFHHNSINILASDASYTGLDSGNCMGVGITGAGFTGTVRVKNNIIRVAQPGGAALVRLGEGGTWDSDSNNLFAAAGAVCCRFGAQDYATLAQWQAASGFDLHSRDIDPMLPNVPYSGCWNQPLSSSSDLHFTAYPGHTYAGGPIPGLDTDIDGEPRDLTAPCMGADELVQSALPEDSDGDGLPDLVENADGSATDNNGDGIADYLQAHVATIINAVTSQPITLTGSAGTTIRNVSVRSNPSPLTAPPGTSFPVGFISFTVEGVPPGGVVRGELHLPEGTGATHFYKFAPRQSDPSTPVWFDFSYGGTKGAVFTGDIIELYLEDGGDGDQDLTVNGRITDPGAPAITQSGVADWTLY